jgi:chromatin segregation and condensation protein Rec8/ScpA/Scc1 (kleisin family)
VETGDIGMEFICSAHTFITKKQREEHMVLAFQELLKCPVTENIDVANSQLTGDILICDTTPTVPLNVQIILLHSQILMIKSGVTY